MPDDVSARKHTAVFIHYTQAPGAGRPNPEAPLIDPLPVDFGKTATDYARNRPGYAPGLFDRLARLSVGLPGQRVVDLGTGPGTLARDLAARGCQVVGVDRSPELLDQAPCLTREAGLRVHAERPPVKESCGDASEPQAGATGGSVDFRVGYAEDTGLPDASFDGVAAAQCWHWFDRPRAAREVRQLLVPGGWLLIVHFDWVPLPGNVVEATEKLIESHNPAWGLGGGTGIHPAWLADAAVAGFEKPETFSFDVDLPYSHEAWRARIRVGAGVGASLPPEKVARFDAELAALLAGRFPAEPLSVPHRVFVLVARAPGNAAAPPGRSGSLPAESAG